MRVTVVTENAERDASADAYQEIYEELRRLDPDVGRYGVSLDAFVAAIGSRFSKAAWSKWQRGEMPLNRAMRNELRRAVGLAALPPTVGEAVAEVDPNALVLRLGEETVRQVLLVGDDVAVKVGEGAVSAAPAKRQPNRRRRIRIAVNEELFEQLNEQRQELGLTWAEMLSRLMEEEKQL